MQRPADATIVRPAVKAADSAPQRHGDGDGARGRGRYLVLAGVGVLVALAAIVGVALSLKPGPAASPGPSAQDTQPPQNVGGLGDNLPPGPPVVTARANPGAVRFSWTYSAQLANDTFRWQTTDGRQRGVAGSATLKLADRPGQRLCVAVKVVRADGSNAALSWSVPGCAG